jgi:hypothetical protein
LFAFSFDWEVSWGGHSNHWTAFFKVAPGLKFVRTHKPVGAGPSENVPGEPMFHYTWLKPGERVRARLETSGMFGGMVEWFDEWFDKVELRDGFECPSHSGGRMTMKRWDGEHPSVLDDHPWRDGKDIRNV